MSGHLGPHLFGTVSFLVAKTIHCHTMQASFGQQGLQCSRWNSWDLIPGKETRGTQEKPLANENFNIKSKTWDLLRKQIWEASASQMGKKQFLGLQFTPSLSSGQTGSLCTCWMITNNKLNSDKRGVPSVLKQGTWDYSNSMSLLSLERSQHLSEPQYVSTTQVKMPSASSVL